MQVTLNQLSKHFGPVKAVDALSLEIAEGEFMALLGPSGCGKTTTLLTVAGFYKPTSGEVRFDGRVVNELPPRKRNIGMVFQSYALYPHMDAFANIEFPLKLQKVPKAQRVQRIRELAELLQISELLDRKPGQLSGGQQQRVALARALAKRPGLLLLDEPLSNLDAKLRISMRAELKSLQKELGITTVFVTHDQVEAMTMADRIAVLNQGKLQQVGGTNELYYSPQNLFVAGFIGTPPMNMFEALLEVREEGAWLKSEFLEVRLPGRISPPQAGPVVVGIRPEDLTVTQGEGVPAEVYVAEPMGRDTLLTLRVGKAVFKAFAPPDFLPQPGTEVNLGFRWEKLHLFDRETGRRLQYGN
jgi:ABC-type sugar transport system ATPase subunit